WGRQRSPHRSGQGARRGRVAPVASAILPPVAPSDPPRRPPSGLSRREAILLSLGQHDKVVLARDQQASIEGALGPPSPPPDPGEPSRPSEAPLIRGIGLPQAVALNVNNMIGIGPFITLPLMVGV